MQQSSATPQGMQNQQFHSQGIYPVSDHDYNLISALANELQGLEKFHQYAQDAKTSKFWQDALQLKKQLAELFTHELAEHAKEGHLGTGAKRTMQ
jgi:hypothetical protein